MGSYGSWSVKGIDDRARAIAKEKARQEGVTLGDYINGLLLEGHSEAGPRDLPPSAAPSSAFVTPSTSSLDTLTRRIEAAEARSTLAITGIDQTVLGLLARLEATEHTSSAMAAEVDAVIDELRETHEALQAKVSQIESDDSARQGLQAMKALEQALGDLATHVYEESGLAQDETSAIKGRMESGFAELGERVDGMEMKVETTLSEAARRVEKAVEQSELRAEGTSRHLSERFSAIESGLATKLAKVDEVAGRMGAVEKDVSGALTSMESTLVRIQDRLNRAENTTDTALKALEHTFASLDERIEAVAQQADPEHAATLRAQLEQRFDTLAGDLRRSIEQTRSDMASEIERAATGANPEFIDRLETSIGTLKQQLVASEDRSQRAVADVSAQVTRMAGGLDTRLRQVEDRDDTAFEHMSEQIRALADQIDARVAESEHRSAGAIEQIGTQVATAIKRVQARQEESAQQVEQKLSAASERQDARLSRALANISERLAGVQDQAVSVLSPVQKAMASLAARLEALEDFNAPPHAGRDDLAPPKVDYDVMPTEPESEPIEPDLAETTAAPAEPEASDHDLDEFVAGLPELDATADRDVDFPEPIESDFAADLLVDPDNGADADYSPFAEEADNLLQAAENEPEDTDPLAALENDLSAWNDGRDEARDSDIFAGMSDEPDVFSEASSETSDSDDDVFDPDGDLSFLRDDEPEIEVAADEEDTDAHDDHFMQDAPVEDLEIDEDATNYLARARRAAISAAAEQAAPARKGRTSKAKAPKMVTASTAGRSKIPAIAAASVLVLATAGAGGYVYLRGKQTPQVTAFAVTPQETTTTPNADTSVTDQPSLAGVDYAEGETGLDEDLFEEEGSVDPETIASATAASANHSALPVIPVRQTLERAALQGDAVAQFKWGEARLNAKDFAVGTDFVRRAADQGLAAAQYRLAKLHEKGLGVPRDLTQSRQWTEKAARGGNVKAMHDLAVFYADGESGAQSYAAAAEWFRKAADFGLVDSQYNLAVLYENGLGISPSQSEALYWYEIAARNGDASAPGNINDLRAVLTLDQAQAASRRAASWQASTAMPAANGNFGPQAWDNGNREQVYALQVVLNGLGFDTGTPDGLAGAGTRNAIRAFQTQAGLPADGEITDTLVAKLNERAQGA